MKIFWLVNSEFPDISEHYGRNPNTGTGSWMLTLLKELLKIHDLEVHIGYGNYVTNTDTFSVGKAQYHLFEFSSFDAKFNDNKINLKQIRIKINEIKPDIVHVFGTERFYGLITSDINIPVVVRMQGVISLYLKYFFLDVPLKESLSLSLLKKWFSFRRKIRTERRVIQINKYFEGQTEWDKAFINSVSIIHMPNYYRNYPILRVPFYSLDWDINKIDRFSITAIASVFPYKGIHTLLKSINILKKSYPTVKLNLLGNLKKKGYGAYISKLIKKFELDNHVVYSGFLGEEDMVNLFSTTHVFVNPSFIENESLAMLEALFVGAPSIVTYTGGMPDNTSGEWIKYFPIAEYAVLADKIEYIFENDNYAIKASEKGRLATRNLLDKNRIAARTLKMYDDIIENYGNQRI